MESFTFTTRKKLSRRTFLKSAGACMALPMLDAMHPALAALSPAAKTPDRFVSLTLPLGLHAPFLTPDKTGAGYDASPYLEQVMDLRNDFTVISGTSHPGVGGGHRAEGVILSAYPNSGGADAKNSISIDQLMAKHLGHETRFPSLVLNSARYNSPSYTENGAMIPAIHDPAKLYAKLFVNESPAEQKKQIELMKQGRSIMDLVGQEAAALKRELGPQDRDKLDEWFTSVRNLEERLSANQDWVDKPKPKVDMPQPSQAIAEDYVESQKTMLQIMHLALQTDSTRFISLHMDQRGGVAPLEGVNEGHHTLSHHGRDEDKIRQLAIIEKNIINEWADFLRKLKNSKERGQSMLENTMVFLTSNLGNASSHNNKNMPVLFAGGGFKHGQHLAFDRNNNYPLPKLYVTALKRLGLDYDKFSVSSGSMQGLDMA